MFGVPFLPVRSFCLSVNNIVYKDENLVVVAYAEVSNFFLNSSYFQSDALGNVACSILGPIMMWSMESVVFWDCAICVYMVVWIAFGGERTLKQKIFSGDGPLCIHSHW